MALVEMDWHPSPQRCRQFGWAALVMAPAIALLLHVVHGLPVMAATGVGLAGALLWALSRVSVRAVRPAYVGLMLLGWPVGWLVGHAMMGLFYFGILTPVGLICRLIGHDPLQRRWDPAASTYWRPYRKPSGTEQYFNQF